MKKTLSFALLLISLVIYSQEIEKNYTFRTLDEVNSYTDDVMNSFSKGKISNAFSILKMKWILPENEIDQLEGMMLKQLNMIEQRFGNVVGYELAKEFKVNQTLLRRYYFLKYDYHTLICVFTFYNSGKGWMLNGFKYNDDFEILDN